jgi:peptidoglycan/xylan/chitin deacetylase (PgdA/CDA1 family)
MTEVPGRKPLNLQRVLISQCAGAAVRLSCAAMFRSFLLVFATVVAAFAQSKVVYLTFDDGPQRGTAEVLDTLKEEQATATFFLTGSNALGAGGIDGQRALVLRTLADGHELGNHGYIHKPMTKADYRATYGDLSTEAQRAAFDVNFQRNEEHFRKILNQPDFKLTMSRLPGDGSTFPVLVAEAERMGMKYFAWDNEFAPNGDFKWLKNYDWHGATGVAADYPNLPADGAVLLMHDRHWAGERRAALKNLLTTLKANGYTFGKLSDRKPPAPRAPTRAPAPVPASP